MEGVDRYIDVDGIKVRYQMAGEGPPLVLVHGLSASLATWKENVEALAQRYTVCALDLPGYGDSDKPRDLEYSAPAGAHFLPQFMDALGIKRATLIGNSGGGLIVALCAINYPHRVEKLVLVDAAGLGKDVRWYLRFASLPLVGELLERHTLSDPQSLGKEIFYQPRSIDDGLARELLRIRNLPEAKRTVLKSIRSGVNFLGLRKRMMILPQLKALPIPMLIIWGEEDRILPVYHAYRASQALPNSRVHVIPQCGHWPQMEKPAEFNELVLRFLDDRLTS